MTVKTGSGTSGGELPASRPLRVADHLKTEAERAAYLDALLEDGDSWC